jgi:predicted phage terminase large subunit-like protein
MLYLLEVIRLKLELPEVMAAIRSENRKDKPALIAIDERGVGLGVYQTLRREGLRNIMPSTATREQIDRSGGTPARPSESKIERFGRASLLIADGQVLIPDRAPWLEAFLYEVAAFPNIADDDQIDSMTQLVANFDRAVRIARQNDRRR